MYLTEHTHSSKRSKAPSRTSNQPRQESSFTKLHREQIERQNEADVYLNHKTNELEFVKNVEDIQRKNIEVKLVKTVLGGYSGFLFT